MIYALLTSNVLANKAEVTSSNLRDGASFDNFKASWMKKFSVGGFDSQLDCSYDYNKNRDFLKDVKLSGNLLDGDGDDLSVGYAVTKNFDGDKLTEVRLTAETRGTKFAAEMNNEDQLKEVSAFRTVDVGDQKLDVEPSFLVKAQTARIKLASAFGKDRVKAKLDYATSDRDLSYELGYERDLDNGREVSATFNPKDRNVDVEFVDSKFEDGATWTAKASVPLEDGNPLDSAKLSLKRAWAW